MLTVLRIVPQLERCVELAAHIAQRAAFVTELPADVVAGFGSMATLTDRMWQATSLAWACGDPAAARALEEDDDELDVLADELTARLGDAGLGWTTAMECRLVVRFYERLGDHAVHVCERIRWWATGA
jgi:phosphate transport system protein